MRVLASALAVMALGASGSPAGKVAYVHGDSVVISYLGKPFRQPIAAKGASNLHWSGDGRLLSIGGRIVGRVTLPARDLVWAPRGETAAYVTKQGGVGTWSPSGRHVIVPSGWGAQTIAWSTGGALAIGRFVCPHHSCAYGEHKEIWVWRAGLLRRVVGPLSGSFADSIPMPVGWSDGQVLWWQWPGSGSIAADGVTLWRGSTKLGTTLMYPDYVATCGAHLAFVEGGDRFSTHGKRILFDGRDVSRDTSKSWVSPSCTANGRLVAAAGRDHEGILGREHRAIWQLLPSRRQLTAPPWGWTDEDPQLLANGSVVFVRTHEKSRKVNGQWLVTDEGKLELLQRGRLTTLADVTKKSDSNAFGDPQQFYGHYGWPSLVAIAR